MREKVERLGAKGTWEGWRFAFCCMAFHRIRGHWWRSCLHFDAETGGALVRRGRKGGILARLAASFSAGFGGAEGLMFFLCIIIRPTDTDFED